jgi:hypothetical protein
MVIIGGANRGRVFYARPEIEVFHGIERFSDYKKIKARMRRALQKRTSAPRGRKHGWRFLLSNRGLAIITAAAAVAGVLIAIITTILH